MGWKGRQRGVWKKKQIYLQHDDWEDEKNEEENNELLINIYYEPLNFICLFVLAAATMQAKLQKSGGRKIYYATLYDVDNI